MTFFACLCLVVGIYIISLDLGTMLSAQRRATEQTALASSRYLPTELIEAGLNTKDSSSPQDRALKKAMRQIKSDMNIQGHISLLTFERRESRMLISTNPKWTKGMIYAWDKDLPALDGEIVRSSKMIRRGSQYYISAVTALDTKSSNLVFVFDSNQTSLAYQMVVILFHYLILGVGVAAVSILIYSLFQRRWMQRTVSLEAQKDAVFNDSSEALMFLDKDCIIQEVNASSLNLLDVSSDKLLGHNLFQNTSPFVTFIPLDPTKVNISKTIDQNEPMSFKARILLGHGNSRYVRIHSKPLPHEEGVLLKMSDITMASKPEIKEQEIFEEPITDPLTRCLNNHYLEFCLKPDQIELLRKDRCSMIVMDIDNFNKINKEWNQLEGDRTLRDLADHLKHYFRHTDKIIRTGSDLFVVLLPKVDLRTASRIANNLHNSLRGNSSTRLRRVTFSMGVAQLDINESGGDWLARADAALAVAKQRGKNRVEVQNTQELEVLD